MKSQPPPLLRCRSPPCPPSPSLMESAHTHHPQSAPIMPCSPYSPWLWLRHAIMVPLPYLTHSYANTRFHRNIWWQEFLSLPSSPSPDYVAISSLGPGIDNSRLIVISHIWCSPRCRTRRRRVFHCRRACFCLHTRHADGQLETDGKNPFSCRRFRCSI